MADLDTEGVKFDEGKNQLELIPPEAMFALGNVLTFGANKYAPRNWELGMKWSRVWGALLRHMFKWLRGEKFDDETGLPHLHHALTCLMFLAVYEERKIGEADIGPK